MELNARIRKSRIVRFFSDRDLDKKRDHWLSEIEANKSLVSEKIRIRESVRHSDFEDVKVPEMRDVPGMISEAEGRYLYWLTSQTFTGIGEVLEVGTWLGKSTSYICAGIRDSEYTPWIYCYDNYVWRDSYNDAKYLKGIPYLKHGADFKPLFESYVTPIYDRLKVYKKDLFDIVWESGPIEIFFLDASKRDKEFISILDTFSSYLLPNFTILIMQDYLHAPSYALAAIVESLGGCFELVHTVSKSSTAAFMIRDHVDPRTARTLLSVTDWSETKILDTWKRILEKLPAQPKDYLIPGRSMHLFDSGYKETACQLMGSANLGETGLQRWKFFASVPYYFKKYKPLFEA